MKFVALALALLLAVGEYWLYSSLLTQNNNLHVQLYSAKIYEVWFIWFETMFSDCFLTLTPIFRLSGCFPAGWCTFPAGPLPGRCRCLSGSGEGNCKESSEPSWWCWVWRAQVRLCYYAHCTKSVDSVVNFLSDSLFSHHVLNNVQFNSS